MRSDITRRFFVISSLAIAACSSDGDILPSRQRYAPTPQDAAMDTAGIADATIDAVDAVDVVEPGDGKKPRDPNANCVKPGTPNNERGVGGYCEPERGDCVSEAGPRFCTADFKEITTIEDDKWFCTTTCTSDDDCGTGARCATSAVGSGCAPIVCIGDGGVTTTARVGTSLSP